MRTCDIAGCSTKHYGRGWCLKHYMRWWHHADPHFVTVRGADTPEVCTLEGCEREYYAKRFCKLHWQRNHITGTPHLRCTTCGVDIPGRRTFCAPCMADSLREGNRARQLARYHKLGGDGARRMLDEIIVTYEGLCGICGEDLPGNRGDIHVDHIYPVSRGGTNELSNLQPAHPACNMKKQDKVTGWRTGAALDDAHLGTA